MFNLENEIVLLKQWAQGYRKEDMKCFEPKVFHYQKLFEAIRDGATIEQLGADISAGKYEGITMGEFYGADGSRAFYYGALGDARNEQKKYYLQKLETETDPDRQEHWIEKLTEITNIINSKETAPKCSNFSDLFITELEERRNERNPRYGLKLLDKETEGLHRGQLIVLSARPGCGKSTLALQIANHVLNDGYKVMYLPLEMSEYETFQRMLVQEQVCYDSSEVKNPEPQKLEEIKGYLDGIEQTGLFSMYQGLNNIADIEKKVKEEEPFLLVIDQLTQVDPVGKAKDIRDKYIQVTNALKRIALNEKVCILAVHQLNREGEGKKNPTLSNLAESDSVGRDADVVLALNDQEETDNERIKSLDLIIAKNRQGRIGAKIPLHFDGARHTFTEPAPKRYDYKSYAKSHTI